MKNSVAIPPPILITGCARSGVYKITCKPTGKSYIGSTVNIKGRMHRHLRALKNGDNSRYLQRAWNKHVEEAFEFEVLLYCSEEDLLFYEQRAMDVYRTADSRYGFNISPIAGSQLGMRHSEETKRKIGLSSSQRSFSHTEEAKRKISIAKKGVLQSPEHRLNNRLSHIGHQHTKETKKKLSKALIGRPKTKEHCLNISRGKTGKPNLKLRGQSASLERRRKVSESITKWHARRKRDKEMSFA